MTKQDHYRHEYHHLHPEWQESLLLYRDQIDALVKEDSVVLDIGCGHADFLQAIMARTPHTYGIDPDAEVLKKNTVIAHTSVGTAETLPYADNFFDVIITAWVLEHVEHPVDVFREVHRVLKPGGTFVFLTPNKWNYVVWINRLIPDRFHDFLTKRLYGRQENDTYPVRYKANSVKELQTQLTTAGFHTVEVKLNGDPSYISFNGFLFAIARAIEWVLNLRPFRGGKVHLLGTARKDNA